MAQREILLPWDSQPQEVHELSALANEAVFFSNFSSSTPVYKARQEDTYPVDVRAPLFSSNAFGACSGGVGVITGASAKSYQFKRAGSASDAYIEIPSGSDYTWVLQTEIRSYVGTNPGWMRAGPGANCFILIPSTGLWVRHGGSDFTASGGRPAGGSLVTVVVSVKSGVSVKAWVNGQAVINAATAVATPAITGADGFNFLGFHNSAEYFEGTHTFLGLWHKALPDAVGQDLSVNPWQLFAPRTIWVPVSSGAAPSFKSAWARNSNTVLVGGRV